MELGKRKEKILATIVEQYILTGEPVGSKIISEKMSLSSATIRNEMAELSEMMYLEQPHTSAGRLPSEKGYRYYVDNLMSQRELSNEEKYNIRSMLPRSPSSTEKLLGAASSALAELTGYAAFSSIPTGETALIKKVEVIPLGKYTALILLITSGGILKNKICRLDTELNEAVINAFYKISDQYFVNSHVNEISTVMIQTLAASLGEIAFSTIPLLAGVADLAYESSEADIHIDGQYNLLTLKEYGENIKDIFELLKRREEFLKLINFKNDGLNISIGAENQCQELSNSSLIAAKNNSDIFKGGLLGIIGPIRIDYAQLIPNVVYLSDILNELLSNALEEE